MNKRKKVSIFYFLEQSVKGLWRNGVMTFASVAVLMSCLVVLGTFVLLLYNVNYNINNIGMLNYILVFVDTSLDPSVSNAELSTVAVTGDQGSNAGGRLSHRMGLRHRGSRHRDRHRALHQAAHRRLKL